MAAEPIAKRARQTIPYVDPRVHKTVPYSHVGDIFEAPGVDYIVHQTNCIVTEPKGLARSIANRIPSACTYADRTPMKGGSRWATPETRAVPGTFEIRPVSPISVVALNAQWELGPAGKYNRVEIPNGVEKDTSENRLMWFETALMGFASHLRSVVRAPTTVALPRLIGCGLAGGDWKKYSAVIRRFARASGPHVYVLVVSRDHVDEE